MKQKLELRQPIEINGKMVKELSYDFDEITCELYTQASCYADAKSLQATQQGKPNAAIMEQNANLHMYLGMAAVTAVNKDIDVADLERLKGYDIVEVTRIGRNFISGRSEEPSGQSSLEGQSESTPAFTIPEGKS